MLLAAETDAIGTSGRPTEPDLAARCAAIELLVLDVDGVLTDGLIVLDDQGVETKRFCVRDGAGISLWRSAGKRAAILSGRSAKVVDLRAQELGMAPVLQGVKRKGERLTELMAELGLQPRQVAFMGDDLPDLPALQRAGLSACPADAAPEVRASVHLITSAPGGRGAVRELVEVLLRHQGHWDRLVGDLMEPG